MLSVSRMENQRKFVKVAALLFHFPGGRLCRDAGIALIVNERGSGDHETREIHEKWETKPMLDLISPELLKALIDQGCTAFIVTIALILAYRLANKFFPQFISTQQDIAVASGRQAENIAQMKNTVHEFVMRDNNEHREIILGLQVVGQELKTLVEQISRLKHGHEGNAA